MEIRRLTYNGSSFLVVIPPTYARKLMLSSGQHCTIELNEENQLVITPFTLKTKKEHTHDTKRD
jgi:antitoxin component of MazEF toxin-antitoxin module